MARNAKVAAVIEYDDAGIENTEMLIRDIRANAEISRLILISAGDYMQNGRPAIRDKKMAAAVYEKAGADLVLELPLCSMLGGYDVPLFAAAALISRLRCVDEIVLPVSGLEDETMRRLAILLFQEPPAFQREMKRLLAEDLTISAAQAKAAEGLMPGAEAILSDPVNRRAVEIKKYLFQLFCCIPTKGLEQGRSVKSAENDPYETRSVRQTDAADRAVLQTEDRVESPVLSELKHRLHTDPEKFLDELSQIPGYRPAAEERLRSLSEQVLQQTDFETCLALLEENERRRDDLRLFFLRFYYGIRKLDQQICAMHTWCPEAGILVSGDAEFTEKVKELSWTKLIPDQCC